MEKDVGSSLKPIKNTTLWKMDVENDAFSDNVFCEHHIPHFCTQSIGKMCDPLLN